MTEEHLRDILLNRHGLRVPPETLQYVIAAMQNSPNDDPIVVIGADAHTGVAMRESISASELRNAARMS